MVWGFGSFSVPRYLMVGCGLFCFRGEIVLIWLHVLCISVGRVWAFAFLGACYLGFSFQVSSRMLDAL